MRILTAGYGNRGFGQFIDLMKRYDVTHLVDVRSVPQSSYWEDFRRENLIDLVPPTGLRYVYMGDTLGGAVQPTTPDERPGIFCRTDPSTFEVQPMMEDNRFQIGLDRLIRAANEPGRVLCLMCGCLRPHACHRSRLIGPALVSRGIDLGHIDHQGNVISQMQVDLETTPVQSSLF